jgi:hypothetical protein
MTNEQISPEIRENGCGNTKAFLKTGNHNPNGTATPGQIETVAESPADEKPIRSIQFQGIEYRLIHGCDDYWVSMDGRAISTRGNGRGITAGRSIPKIITGAIDAMGYRRLCLRPQRKSKNIYLHLAVIIAWKGAPPSPEHECRHLDGNTSHLHISNLEWGTPKENAEDKRRHGTIPAGMRSGNHKLTDLDVLRFQHDVATGRKTIRALAEEHPEWCHRNIWAAVTGRSWRHLPDAVTIKTPAPSIRG